MTAHDGEARCFVPIPEWNTAEPFFRFSGKDSNLFVARHAPSRVLPDDKLQPCSNRVSANKSINRVYPNAIELTSPSGQMVRSGAFVAGSFAATGAVFFLYFLIDLVRDSAGIGISIVPFLGFCVFALAAIWIFRAPFIQPTDLPVIFNRKTRQVSFMRMRLPNLLKFWAPLRIEYRSYPWEQVRVRSYQVTGRMVGTSAITSTTVGKLCLLWGHDPDDPSQFKDWTAVGLSEEDDRLLQLWEHIRRYMEEDGPAINAGESLRKGVYDSKWNAPKPDFPAEIIAAAGGLPLSDVE